MPQNWKGQEPVRMLENRQVSSRLLHAVLRSRLDLHVLAPLLPSHRALGIAPLQQQDHNQQQVLRLTVDVSRGVRLQMWSWTVGKQPQHHWLQRERSQ